MTKIDALNTARDAVRRNPHLQVFVISNNGDFYGYAAVLEESLEIYPHANVCWVFTGEDLALSEA
jgi:hypothetical protein